jgi:minor extracellular serine protease Vpr
MKTARTLGLVLAAALCAESAAAAPARLDLSARLSPQTRDGRRGYIVLLREEPVAAALAATRPAARVQTLLAQRAPEARSRAAELLAGQDLLLADLRARMPRITVGARYTMVLDGFAALLTPEDALAIRRDPRVKSVTPVRKARLDLDASNPLMGAPTFWTKVGGEGNAGKGVKIAVLDTGVDFSNPMFSDPSLPMPAGFPKENDGNNFANSKVIVAKYFQSVYESSDPGLSPLHRTAQDLSGHGSGTSSAAAGARVELSGAAQRHVTLEGVAPKAYLGDYKVFSPDAYDDNILAAIDEAVADGMDMISMSFGFSDFGMEPEIFGLDPKYEALKNAADAGVVVTVAAGNDGPAIDSISEPANGPDVVAVGASTNTHDGLTDGELAVVRVAAGQTVPPPGIQQVAGLPGFSSVDPFPADGLAQAPFADMDNLDGPGAGTGCTPLLGEPLSGQIVLIQRGICSFKQKLTYAARAGAAGAVVYNCANGCSDSDGENLVSMDVDCSESGSPSGCTTIPSVFLKNSDGLAVKAYLDANAGSPPSAKGSLAIPTDVPPIVFDGLTPHELASFSSMGPTLDLRIKPDLVTIGTGSYLACENDDPLGAGRFNDDYHGLDIASWDPAGFIFEAGTSFSAPRAAGSAALVRQLQPGWNAREIKAALMETAARGGAPSDSQAIGSLPVMSRGSGEIDLAAASAVQSLVLPAQHSFGRIAMSSLPYPVPLSTTFTIENKSGSSVAYQLAASPEAAFADPAVSPSVSPSSMTLGPGESGTFTLTLSLAASLRTGQNDSEGFVAVSDGGGTIPGLLYVPYWIRVAYKNGSAPVLQTLTAAFPAADPKTLSVDFSAHDDDADVDGYRLAFYDPQDFLITTLPGDFSSQLVGQLDSQGEIQVTGADPASCSYCAAVRLQLLDKAGNASGILYARFQTPSTEAVPAPSAARTVRAFPLVAHGQGTRFFQSDVRIVNPDPAAQLPLDLYFVPLGSSGASAIHVVHPIAPRQSFGLDDVVLSDFGSSNGIGDLVLVSKEGKPFLASSHTYDREGGGLFGTSAPGVSPAQALGAGEGTAMANGLPTGDGFHTNVGATEVTGTATSVEIHGYDESGNDLGVFTGTVPAYGNLQLDPVAEGKFSAKPARIGFRVLSGGRVIPYGASVDDGSGDISLSIARLAPESAEDLVVGETAHVHGKNGTFFLSDLSVSNTSDGPRTVAISLLPNALSGTPLSPTPITLAAGQTLVVSDVLQTLFGLTGDSAAGLRIHPQTPAALTAAARTFTANDAPGGTGQYGFFLTASRPSEALASGGTSATLHAAQNAQFRTNFVMTEVSGHAASVLVTFRDEFGTAIGSRLYAVPAGSALQDTVSSIVGTAEFANGYLEFEVASGSGKILPILSLVDNVTGDAIAVPGEAEP